MQLEFLSMREAEGGGELSKEAELQRQDAERIGVAEITTVKILESPMRVLERKRRPGRQSRRYHNEKSGNITCHEGVGRKCIEYGWGISGEGS